jgi:hypothetical protein
VRIAIAAPATGQSALPASTRPSAKVQMVSTQPELPVRCCTTQAPAIGSRAKRPWPPARRDTEPSCKIPNIAVGS